MKAATHTHYGPPTVFCLQEVARPRVGDGQVLIQVHACPVTQGDRRLRSADFPGIGMIMGRLMFGIFRPRHSIPGTMFAGRVVAIGAGVTRFAVGDDIFGACDHGAYAEYMVVQEDSAIARIPEGFEYDQAAAIPYGAGCALVFLRDIAKVERGQRVLIIGAAGGVGRFAVQIARHLGAEVTGVCSGSDAEMVKKLGATAVFDYRQQDFTKNGQTYDVIFDTAAGDRFRACRGSLSEKGRYVTVYLNGGVLLQMLMTSLLGGRKVASAVVMGAQELTEEVAKLMEQGVIWPVIAAEFALDEIIAAHELFENGEPKGAVVVRVSDLKRSAPHGSEHEVKNGEETWPMRAVSG